MQRTGEQPVDLSVKEQNLLSTCSLARHHQRGAQGETKSKTAEGACVAYAEATETSGKDVVEIHPIPREFAGLSLWQTHKKVNTQKRGNGF